MAILENHFYHRTIATLTGVFGTIFDEIKIVRKDGKTVLVPIAYAVKQRYNVRNTQNPDPLKSNVKMQLPRMSYKLTGMRRDPSRATSKFARIVDKAVDRTQALSLNAQMNRVPYTFSFQLNIKTKTIDDMLQVVEQIVVNFNTPLSVLVDDNKDVHQDSAIVIKLLDTGIEDMSEGGFEDEQSFETVMNFELDGWLYMPTSVAKVIKKVTVNVFDGGSKELLEQVVET